MMMIHVQSHDPDEEGVLQPSHREVYRWWNFCGPGCRDAWYAEPTEEPLVPHASRGWQDRNLRLAAIRIDPTGTELIQELHDVTPAHDTHEELDAYWQSDGPIVGPEGP